MKVIQRSADILVVKTEFILAALFGVGFILMSFAAVYSYILYADTNQGEDFFGLGASAAVLFLFTLVSLHKSEFVFDRGRRILTWKKRTVFTNRSGRLHFDAIKSITVQSHLDDDKARSARVAIIAKTGELPLTRSYSGNTSQSIRIAEKLNQWVFSETPDLCKESILLALAEGRRGEALRILVQTYSLAMDEAKAILDRPEKLAALSSPKHTADFEINSGDKTLVLGITALITLVCGPLFLYWGISGLYKGNSSAGWPQAEAVITAAWMDREFEDNFYRFKVEYRYSVDGLQYRHTEALHIETEADRGFPTLAKLYLKDHERVDPDDYRRGKVIDIHYNPDNPQSAVIIRGVSGVAWMQTLAGGFFTLIYLYLARKDLRERGAKRKREHL